MLAEVEIGTEVKQPIKVAVLGMDERSLARMSTIFKIIYKGRCEFSQGDEASLLIVDLDGETDAWEKSRKKYPGLPAIVMSTTPSELEGATYVAKPAKLDQLWDSISGLTECVPQESPKTNKESPVKAVEPDSGKSGIGSAANAVNAQFKDTSTGSKVLQGRSVLEEASLYFNPDDYLLGRVLSSIKENSGKDSVINVQCWNDRKLILFPDQNRSFSDLTDSQLKNLGVAVINEEFKVEIDVVSGVSKKEFASIEKDGLQSMSIEYLLWDLALRTSRGRVPEGTDLSELLYLQCWPNFTRLPRTPHSMRISSLWVENPRTLDDIAANLGIGRDDVYSFYSAALVTGMAGSAKRQVDTLVAPKVVDKGESKKRGLLTSILRHISE